MNLIICKNNDHVKSCIQGRGTLQRHGLPFFQSYVTKLIHGRRYSKLSTNCHVSQDTGCIKGKMAILVKFFISYLTNYFLYSNYLMALITSVHGSVLRLLLFFSKYILWRNYPQLQILNKRLRHITKALVALEIKVENFIIFLSFTNGNTSIS